MLSRIEIRASMLHKIRVCLLQLNYSWSIEFNDFQLEEMNSIFSTQRCHAIWHVFSPELRVIIFITADTNLKRFQMVLLNTITNAPEIIGLVSKPLAIVLFSLLRSWKITGIRTNRSEK